MKPFIAVFMYTYLQKILFVSLAVRSIEPVQITHVCSL